MDAKRFEALADAFGADVRRWPDVERDDARRFIDQHPAAARAIVARADALDNMLWASPAPEPSEALRERIMAAAPGPTGRRPSGPRTWRWLVGAGVGGLLAASCALGLAVGVAVAPTALAQADRIGPADPINEAARFLREPADATEG